MFEPIHGSAFNIVGAGIAKRGIYTPQRVSFMPTEQYRDRSMLFAWVSQLAPAADVTTYLPALRRLGVRAVLLHDPGAAQRSIRDDPRVGEFTLARQIGRYQLYFIDSSQ